jgi:probable F420-dependent oxidoreductase
MMLGDEFVSAQGIAICAEAAEAAGFDAVFVTEHPVPGEQWLETGGHHALDPFVALSFAAAATTTIALHTNLLVVPYRNPLLAAKSIASLDVLSGGRLIVGLGAGYLEPEFKALGANYTKRGAVVEDAVVAMRKAWMGEVFQHDGIGYKAAGNVALPTPLQLPHPPLWFGGNSVAAMRRAVTHGQGWMPMPSPKSAAKRLGTPGIESMADLRERVTKFDELAAAAGRSGELDLVCLPQVLSGFGNGNWTASEVIEEASLLGALGCTWLSVTLPAPSRGEYLDHLNRFGELVLRWIRRL